MDAVTEIKARLSIEELVSEYVQLKKKGRVLLGLCPFHNDSHPSLQVSPDKGIAYCFACRTGGDIFSFYQFIESVDFRQALKDLGEKTGVKVDAEAPRVDKDRKSRLRECLETANAFYRKNLRESAVAWEYLTARKVPREIVERFQVGFAPDSFSDTYQYLLKEGFSRQEIVDASLGIVKDLSEGKIYDRFRNRLMFPIFDHQGAIIGFGGRTLGEDDAKYINSGETPLYVKSTVLYGLHLAKEAIRKSKRVILVEGYFDVLACHRVGVEDVVSVSGTALTEQHVKILERCADEVILCLDQDRAGADAAERAFLLCAAVNLPVRAVGLPFKDPDEAANAKPEELRELLQRGGQPYLDAVIESLRATDIHSADAKRSALRRLLPLLHALPSAVERGHYIAASAALLGTTETALREDLESAERPNIAHAPSDDAKPRAQGDALFSSTEVALGLFLLFPRFRNLLDELIPPSDGFALALYGALKALPADASGITIGMLNLPEGYSERAAVLQLFCENHGFADWAESLALREIHSNCGNSNREILNGKKREIAAKIRDAQQGGRNAEETQLRVQLQEIYKLGKMTG